MQENQYRALVVDDEPAVRQLTMRALSRRGFRCEPAPDGARAADMAASAEYDVIVTDLYMPNQHGYGLAVELAAQDRRPAIVVVTGVAEPKIAKDLLAHGVDDILFKPVDYDFLAAKVEAIVRRRLEHLRCTGNPGLQWQAHGEQAGDAERSGSGGTEPVWKRSEIESKLAHLSKILPMSQAASCVLDMTSSEDFETVEIAAAVARDASLSADILRLANSGFYNPLGTEVTGLEEAVVRVGQKRISELAQATTAMAALTTSVLPWLNVDLAWRRSIASGVAVDLLLNRAKTEDAEDGLFLSTIMHSLGRIALAMLYPRQYEQMVRGCQLKRETLVEQEKRAFPLCQGEAIGLILRAWDVPPSVYEPLSHVTRKYASLSSLQEPLRTKTELLKLAILIGRLAVGAWEPWDCVEFPPGPVLTRLGIEGLDEVVEETKADSAAIIEFTPQQPRAKHSKSTFDDEARSSSELLYCNLSPEPFDFLAAIVSSMDIRLTTCDLDALESADGVLINCIWTPPFKLAALVNPRISEGTRVIVTDGDNPKPFAQYGEVLQMPMSYARLQSACMDVARLVVAGTGGSTAVDALPASLT